MSQDVKQGTKIGSAKGGGIVRKWFRGTGTARKWCKRNRDGQEVVQGKGWSGSGAGEGGEGFSDGQRVVQGTRVAWKWCKAHGSLERTGSLKVTCGAPVTMICYKIGAKCCP